MALHIMLKIIYMAKLKEQLSIAEETIEWPGGTRDELIQLLRSRNKLWHETLAPENVYKIAINNSIAHQNAHIPENAEVALLPPVTGG
ncbi:MoaD/ThiS family protein [Advenella alkanexedens]|uniref:MoaD/ThiS family protein n=1 Tax=Advenella alkanexedens TaxID=1481665 RepID=UPI0026744642|nr:MoaD/ThiS family protein [Advenella alkanexedens]WKU20736.1 MoaD/ThiS family protein [Advenella alkanexedens]